MAFRERAFYNTLHLARPDGTHDILVPLVRDGTPLPRGASDPTFLVSPANKEPTIIGRMMDAIERTYPYLMPGQPDTARRALEARAASECMLYVNFGTQEDLSYLVINALWLIGARRDAQDGLSTARTEISNALDGVCKSLFGSENMPSDPAGAIGAISRLLGLHADRSVAFYSNPKGYSRKRYWKDMELIRGQDPYVDLHSLGLEERRSIAMLVADAQVVMGAYASIGLFCDASYCAKVAGLTTASNAFAFIENALKKYGLKRM